MRLPAAAKAIACSTRVYLLDSWRQELAFHKERSDLDIALDDRADDAAYLDTLEKGLRWSLESIEAELAIYVAGADPYLDDTFGRLAVSKRGLAGRDQLVLECCRAAGLPVAITMAGGYARNVNDTVDIHFQTVATAIKMKEIACRVT